MSENIDDTFSEHFDPGAGPPAEKSDRIRKDNMVLARLVDAAPDSFIVVDENQRIVFFNKTAEKMFGYSEQHLLGRRIEKLIPERWQSNHERFLSDFANSSDVPRRMGSQPVLVAIRSNGDEFPVEATITKMNVEGQMLFAVILRDLTTQVEREATMRRLEIVKKHAQRMESIGRLAGGIAHDFNNILTIITNYCDLIEIGRDGSPDLLDDVNAIRSAAIRASDLVRQLLAFGRKQILQPDVVDLNDIVTGMDRLLSRLLGEDIFLVVDLDPSPAPIYADPGQIEQVIINLALNARDAMPSGGTLTITTLRKTLEGPEESNPGQCIAGKYAVLRIADTGTGMPESDLRYIFEPFFTTKEVGRGSGLGLASVHGIVTQSGGGIEVESSPGQGTTFEAYFPVSRHKSESAQLTHEPLLEGGGETILVIEDEEGVRKITTFALQTAGYTVLAARDGYEAIRISESTKDPIQLILSDVVMLGMNGVEVVNRILVRRPSTKILFMTGYTEDAVIARGMKAGEFSVLLKPFRSRDLISKVQDVLNDPPLPRC